MQALFLKVLTEDGDFTGLAFEDLFHQNITHRLVLCPVALLCKVLLVEFRWYLQVDYFVCGWEALEWVQEWQ